MGSQHGLLAGEIGGTLTGGKGVCPPSQIADGNRVFPCALQQKGLKVAVNAQLVGKGIADDGNVITRPDYRLGTSVT